jgi:hypothetical protein
MAEIDAQLSKAKQAVRYQELKAPVDGVVFDLQPRSQRLCCEYDSEPADNSA